MPHPDYTRTGQFARNWSDGPADMLRRTDEPPTVNLHSLEAKAARNAVAYWLAEAEQAQGIKHRRGAFETACRIRKAMRLTWEQVVIGQQAVAGVTTSPRAS